LFEKKLNSEARQNIINQEIVCLTNVLKISEKSLEQIDTVSINVLEELLTHRQQWINKIQKLEENRNSLSQDKNNYYSEMEKISKIAKDLVEIDKKIYKALEIRKMKYLKELSNNSVNKNISAKHALNYKNDSNIIDITQE